MKLPGPSSKNILPVSEEAKRVAIALIIDRADNAGGKFQDAFLEYAEELAQHWGLTDYMLSRIETSTNTLANIKKVKKLVKSYT